VSVIQYLLDENVAPVLRTALHQECPDMVLWYVGEAGVLPKGTFDPEILDWCERNETILVTNNRASMPVHLQDHLAEGGHVPGIFILNAKMSIEQTVEELAFIWELADPDMYIDQIRFMPIFR
jgi:hypothetical protein